jgi:hypothetical protein
MEECARAHACALLAQGCQLGLAVRHGKPLHASGPPHATSLMLPPHTTSSMRFGLMHPASCELRFKVCVMTVASAHLNTGQRIPLTILTRSS